MELDCLYKNLILWDGAMGTVLQQRGLPPGGKPELLNFTDPGLLRGIFQEYIQAGSCWPPSTGSTSRRAVR